MENYQNVTEKHNFQELNTELSLKFKYVSTKVYNYILSN